MLGRSVNYVLRYFGLQLVRARKKKKPLFPPSREERQYVDRVLAEFAGTQSPGSGLNDLDEWKKYLSDGRISFFHEILQRISEYEIRLKELRVADVGSGTGYLLRLIAESEPSAKLSGFDTFVEVNSLAKMLCPSAEFDATGLQADHHDFDLIFCTEVLEHLISPRDLLRQLVAALAPGGRLILTVPNGRTDSHPARKRREDGTGYWGHVHFWSPEIWPLFLADVLPKDASIETGLMESGENYGIVQLVESNGDGMTIRKSSSPR